MPRFLDNGQYFQKHCNPVITFWQDKNGGNLLTNTYTSWQRKKKMFSLYLTHPVARVMEVGAKAAAAHPAGKQ